VRRARKKNLDPENTKEVRELEEKWKQTSEVRKSLLQLY